MALLPEIFSGVRGVRRSGVPIPSWAAHEQRVHPIALGVPQQREVTHRFMIMRFRSGATPTAIIPRRSASLMAARTFALPTLARSAIRATGRVHFPVAAASFRMTASTAIASVFRCSSIEGGTTTVAARNRRPRTTRWTVSDLLLFSTIRVSILETPGSKRGGSPKIRAADFGQRPLSYHA